jgi:methylglutaconyl-CoA hydratase/polyketide biosynthesis enoyl-CoA hydratase PksH
MERMKPGRVQIPETLDAQTVRELRSALAAAFADTAIRVVTLTGSARCFCRGMDLGAALRTSETECVAVEFAACLSEIRFARKPVIAAVEGPAIGGGVGLAAAADLVIASPGATFGLTELLFGLLPAIILPYMLERLSVATVRLWSLAGQTWRATEAHSAGLVDIVTAGTDCDAALSEWARRLGRAEPSTVGLWKRYTAQAMPFDRDIGVAVTAGMLRDPKVVDRIRRFVEEEDLPWL